MRFVNCGNNKFFKDDFKSLNHGIQTKWNQQAKKVAICRGSLAWLGRQTHNLEIKGAKRLIPEVTGSNPVPGTTNFSFGLNVFTYSPPNGSQSTT
jgi:hypothetical protein